MDPSSALQDCRHTKLGHHSFLPTVPCANKIKVISCCHTAQLSLQSPRPQPLAGHSRAWQPLVMASSW